MTPVAFAYMCISFWWIFILRSTQQKKLRIQHNLNLKMKVERKLVKWITEKKGTAETSCWVTPSNLCPSTLNCILFFFYFFSDPLKILLVVLTFLETFLCQWLIYIQGLSLAHSSAALGLFFQKKSMWEMRSKEINFMSSAIIEKIFCVRETKRFSPFIIKRW